MRTPNFPYNRPSNEIDKSNIYVREYISALEMYVAALLSAQSKKASEDGWKASAEHARRTGGTL